MAIANKPTELTEQVLESVRTGEQAALDAVRKFIDTVDQALPRLGAAPSWRQQVIDSGLEMADGLVQAQYDFLRNVVHSAGQSLGASPPAEKELTGPGRRFDAADEREGDGEGRDGCGERGAGVAPVGPQQFQRRAAGRDLGEQVGQRGSVLGVGGGHRHAEQ